MCVCVRACVRACAWCVCVCVRVRACLLAHRAYSLRVYRNDVYQYFLETSLTSTFILSHTDIKQECKNRRRNSVRTTKFCLKALNICGPNLEVNIRFLAPRT